MYLLKLEFEIKIQFKDLDVKFTNFIFTFQK